MAFVLNDRVKETSVSTGTGTINLSGAETGFESFVSGVGNSNKTFYAIIHDGTTEFEVGIGTVTDAATDTLSRDTVISSSNSDSKVNFSVGTKTVICTYPASKHLQQVWMQQLMLQHNSTISDDQTIDSGVLAGPVAISGTLTVTGILVVM